MKRPQPHDRLQLDLLEWGPIERKLAVRRVRCVEPLDKLVLAILEGHIDPETGHWSMPVDRLADECGLSESSCRRILNRLDTDPRCTFIRWERQRGRTPQFSIIWENIRDAILASGAAGSSANRDRTRRRSSANTDGTLAESSATADGRFRQIGGGSSVIAVTEPLYKELTELTDIQPPPPTDSEPDAVVVAVVATGVVMAAEAVATARSNGMTDAAILEHVRHFADNPGRWGAGALAKRLQSPTTPLLALDQALHSTKGKEVEELQFQKKQRPANETPGIDREIERVRLEMGSIKEETERLAEKREALRQRADEITARLMNPLAV